MKIFRRIVVLTIVMAVAFLSCRPEIVGSGISASGDAGWTPVERAMGRPGIVQDDVLKFSLPRSDLKITRGDVQISPALALGSWVAFKKAGNGSMVMGDLVLTESEVAPVMKKLEDGGIEITALHNHLLGESPRVMYMHIGGHGDPVTMAGAIHGALALTGTPFEARGNKTFSGSVNTTRLDEILGYKGRINGDVYQFSIPRAEKIMDNGMEVPPSMGVAMPVNFQPTGDGKAAISGDLVLTANEVNPVIRSLRDHGIEVTAVHSHMLTEEPRLFFLHFWANDNAYDLAGEIRATLNEINVAPGGP